ncbi:MAG: hypothetical protein E7365_07675 [Clostridiales bacterium]|nr:hypothetical protein [Clostridiales bacterium]
MASITSGLKKRGARYLYDGKYPSAVECFTRAYLMDPTDTESIIELIYALNQNADYIKAITFAYAYLGEFQDIKKKDTLYFLTAEAFGGVGCVEGCAQMLERCINLNPNGASSEDARKFLNELKQKYTIDKYDANSEQVSMTIPNALTDAPFLNYETLMCMKEVSEFIKEQKLHDAIKRIEEELENGNVTVSLLGVAIMLGAEVGDSKYVLRNAQRFKFVEDYTTSELYSLAYNLTDLNDDDIAYTVYRELYMKESGDKDIAFGFAVACERIGDISHAKEITKQIILSEGGIGPASYYYNEIGSRNHSYLLRYEGAPVEKILLNKDYKGFNDNNSIFEAIDFFRFTQIETATEILDKLDADNIFTRLELRRIAIEPKVNLLIRARSAAKVYEKSNKVFFNTGSDIIEFTPQIENVINNFFNRGLNETVD